MANTTPSAIHTAIKALIAGLTPIGADIDGEVTYQGVNESAYKEDPEMLPESELDRHFIAHAMEIVEAQIQGGITSNLHEGAFEIAMGHAVSDSYEDGRDRRDNDTHQVITQLMKPANRPAGVHWIHFESAPPPETIKDGKYFWSLIRFSCSYHIDSNYGG